MPSQSTSSDTLPDTSVGLDPASRYADGTYLDANRGWHAEDSPWKTQQILRLLQRNQLVPHHVAEVGCGAGGILQQLSAVLPDSHFVGFERSPQAIALCKDKETAHLRYRADDIFLGEEVFDCLLCIDVFEHVEDYMGFIRRLRTKAQYKIFHIPLDISFLSLMHSSMIRARQLVGHLHYFTQETAIATLVDCGHTVIDGFFTAPFSALPSKSLKARLARFPRSALFSLSPALSARMLGGCGYLVLTR
jgi:hypothetical protein